MTEGRFTEDDLLPSDDDRCAARRATIDRAAASVAVLAVGMWIGGLTALGACAAPFVFGLAKQIDPTSPLRDLMLRYAGDAMGAAFARFDQIALGASLVLLAAEGVRTWAAGRRARGVAARVRRSLAILMAASAAYVGFALTPTIAALHRAGAVRGEDEAGQQLDRTHHTAEAVGKAELAFGAALIFLHVFTLATRRPEDDDEDALAPLPPGDPSRK